MRQTYKYIIDNSILNDDRDEISLDFRTEYLLFKFFIVNTPCDDISRRGISFENYGWLGKINKKNGLQQSLKPIFDLDLKRYIFTDINNLTEKFKENDLVDCKLKNIDLERCVIGKTLGNKLQKFCRHIRNCFSHGKYIVVLNSINELTLVMQDDNRYNVTARIVIKVSTLVEMIKIIDIDNLIGWKEILEY